LTTLVSAWKAAKARLEAAGVEGPVIDARLLVEAASGASRVDIITDPHRLLTDEQALTLESLVSRREKREPVSHILGVRGFWKIMLKVTPDVLTPRPDTESLLDVLLPRIPVDRAVSVLDLGVGSGAILLAILSERPAARGLGVDVSAEAVAVARENAANLGLASRVALLRGDWTAGLAFESFDVVVANPPYIATGDLGDLAPEVRDHEPRLALDGGYDGLEAYRAIAPQIMRVLRPDGVFAVEIGLGQAAAVQALFQDAGAMSVSVHNDLTDRQRIVAGMKKALGEPSPTG
jgi:release factor glutamine methyltransferase